MYCRIVQPTSLVPCAQVNTNAVVLVSKGMVHTEGGWPKEVDCTEVEQTIRFRRKVHSAPCPSDTARWSSQRICQSNAQQHRPTVQRAQHVLPATG